MKNVISFWLPLLIVIFFKGCRPLPTPEDFVPKLDVYATHATNTARLKENDLEFLTMDLNELYEHCNEAKNVFYETAYNFIDFCLKQIDPLSKNFNKILNCVNDTLRPELVYFKNSTETMRNLLEASPHSKTCYKDILIWINDVKSQHEKLLNSSKYFQVEEDLADMDYFLDLFEPYLGPDRAALDDEFNEAMNEVHQEFEEFITEVEDVFEEYINHLLEAKKTGASNADLKSISKEKLLEYENDFLEYIKDLKTDLDQDLLDIEEYIAHVTGEMLELFFKCRDDETMLKTTLNQIESILVNDIHKMELYAEVKVYLVENDNKTLVECNDHVPYDGSKPDEKFIKAIHKNGTTETYTVGRDENHRIYERTNFEKRLDPETTLFRENITYLDKKHDKHEVVIKNYHFVWK